MVDGRSRRHAHAHTNRQTKQTETSDVRSHTGSVQSRKGFREFAKVREGSHQPGSEGTRARVSHIISKRLAPRRETVRHSPNTAFETPARINKTAGS